MRMRKLIGGGAVVALWTAISMAHAAAAPVNVLYAGSLVNLMEKGVGPAFDKADHETFQGFAGGSKLLANQIKGKLRRADVFISAVPKVNAMLMGASNGDWVRWYATFAASPLVIGFNPKSRFAADLKTKPWYDVLQEPGIRIGRTDPRLDPKGSLTVQLFQKTEQIDHLPGLAQKVLGAPENPAQVFPEETLVGRLQSGQIDVGFFYSTETSELKIPAIALPKTVGLGATYTVSIPQNPPNPAGAARFVAFLLGPTGRALMRQHGLSVSRPIASGDLGAAPGNVRDLIAKSR